MRNWCILALALVSAGCQFEPPDKDGDGYVDLRDCDDENPDVYPDAEELCDALDNDCDRVIDEGVPEVTHYLDRDDDGYGDSDVSTERCDPRGPWVANGDDCDDQLAAVNPGAAEICDAIDNNCDGHVDTKDVEDAPTWYLDDDGDGFGYGETTLSSCEMPDGYADNAEDCDDGDALISPSGEESCDAVDNDCDASIDEDGKTKFFRDADGDGFGDDEDITKACDAPEGYVTQPGDCDDQDAALHPGDGDEDGVSSCDGDCDDSNAALSPSVSETCDGLDNDCDGAVDNGVQSTYYADEDGDGYGDGETIFVACVAPDGYVSDATDCDDGDSSANSADADGDGVSVCGGDCDDGDASIHPNQEEICDGIDNNCDTVIDYGVKSTFYADTDGDGYGDADSSVEACEAPEGYVENASDCDDDDALTYGADLDGDGVSTCDGDCDDSNAAIHPNQGESCDGLDNDCDGQSDEGLIHTFYADGDGDGFGDASDSVDACEAPSGYVGNTLDCDDSDAAIHPGDGDGDGVSTCDGDCDDSNDQAAPGLSEACDGVDNDCDGHVDNDVDGASTWYLDADGDGDGDGDVSIEACVAPEGYVATGDDCDDDDAAIQGGDNDGDGHSICDNDCDDDDPSVYAGATEVCDGVDNDCDGVIDPHSAEDASDWYIDADGDGQGVETHVILACNMPEGYAATAGDCDDSDASLNSLDADGDGFVSCEDDCDDTDSAINPGAIEICDGLDNDCDEVVDPNDSVGAPTFYADADGDGAGNIAVTAVQCSAPSGYVSSAGDCNDGDGSLNLQDIDGDGNTSCGGDCDDNHPEVFVGMQELCTGIDNDCDGNIDEGAVDATTLYADSDGDGDGDIAFSIQSCDPVSGYVVSGTDCDDSDSALHGLDSDSDGFTTCGSDCDDGDAAIHPEAAEVCDNIDNNCDGSVDPYSSDDAQVWYFDGDEDGSGIVDVNVLACYQPTGYVGEAGDCDDDDAELEALDVDEDGFTTCDGDCDDSDADLNLYDEDEDGYTTCDVDCDDTDPAVLPVDADEDGEPDPCGPAEADFSGIALGSAPSTEWSHFGVTFTDVTNTVVDDGTHGPFVGDQSPEYLHLDTTSTFTMVFDEPVDGIAFWASAFYTGSAKNVYFDLHYENGSNQEWYFTNTGDWDWARLSLSHMNITHVVVRTEIEVGIDFIEWNTSAP